MKNPLPFSEKFANFIAQKITPNTKHQTPNTKHQTPNTKHQTPNTKHQTPNTKHQTQLSSYFLINLFILFLTISPFVSNAQITVSANTNWNTGNPPPSNYNLGITITSMLF